MALKGAVQQCELGLTGLCSALTLSLATMSVHEYRYLKAKRHHVGSTKVTSNINHGVVWNESMSHWPYVSLNGAQKLGQEGVSGISKPYGGSRTHERFRSLAIEKARVCLRTTFDDIV